MKRSREPDEDSPETASPAAPLSSSGTGSSIHSDEETAAALPPSKIVGLDPFATLNKNIEMRCSLPPHKEPLHFRSYEDYETHYRKAHSNRCIECRKNFPSAHLLSVHAEEMHDPFAQVLREKGERTYSCFVEGCDRKCSTPQKRRMHLIDKHMYPKNFFFAVTRDGIDGRRSLLLEGGHRRRRSSVATAASQPPAESCSSGPDPAKEKPPTKANASSTTEQKPDEKPDIAMDDLTGAMSSLQFVPPSIRFGRGGRAGFAKR